MNVLLVRNLIVICAMTAIFMMTMLGCKSRPILPDRKAVTVSREAAHKSCTEIGVISGRTATVKGTQEQAVEDLKIEAAQKGANYVVIKQFTATAATGVAYDCP